MKKLSTVALAIAALVFAACEKEKSFTIDWDLGLATENGLEVDSVVLAIDGATAVSTSELKNGHAILKGDIDEPALGTVTVYFTYNGQPNSTGFDVVVEPGKITTDEELNFARGTALNDAALGLFEQIDSLMQANKDCTQLICDYVEAHKNDVSVILVLTHPAMTSLLDYSELSALFDKTADAIRQNSKMQALKEKLDLIASTAPGNMFVDFEAEYDGKVQHLSDYVGKGKYVLVDFWASWCGPCRNEIPNIIEVYNKYNGNNFTVIGVATWDKPEDTLRAIGELGIPYPQIMNAQYAGSTAYGIEGIPEIILFGPDGTILKRGLRGDDIEKAVKACLGL
ncbi:MAG: TlpA family protein disulfide reductase [Prevotellaceae bacterium]|nr:TlpA family protein disulfide reductase [Prevotellaceae bacterium]